jgi:Iap family predicted aminopeptidase
MITEELDDLGETRWDIEDFAFLNWVPEHQELSSARVKDIPVTQLGYSGEGDVEAELANCGGGTAEECHNAREKLALCSPAWGQSLRFLHRIQMYRNAVEAGALGFILAGEPGHPPPEGMIRKRQRGDIPAVSVSHEVARKYLEDGTDSGRFRMIVSNSVEEDRSGNVVCRLGGGNPGIAVCAHTDSWSTGAWDNASGVALMLELTATLNGEDLNHEVMLCFAGAEEFGLFGSRDFCQRHAPEIGLAINVDGVGLDGAEIQVRCSDRSLASIPPLKGIYSELPLTPWGDHFSFHAAGIPTMFMTSGGVTPIQHTREDSPKILNPEDLEASLFLLREIVTYEDSIL